MISLYKQVVSKSGEEPVAANGGAEELRNETPERVLRFGGGGRRSRRSAYILELDVKFKDEVKGKQSAQR